jgi:hypothetical protein
MSNFICEYCGEHILESTLTGIYYTGCKHFPLRDNDIKTKISQYNKAYYTKNRNTILNKRNKKI